MTALYPLRSIATRALVALATVAGCAVIGAGAALATTDPSVVRPLAAILVAADLVLLCLRFPRGGVVATLVFLAALGLVRRLLIPVAAWTSFDPLLLVGPAMAALLLIQSARQAPRRRGKRVAAMVAMLLGLTVIEAVNPEGGGLVAGVTGLLFLAVPLLWFFIGRRGDDRLLGAVLAVTLAGAVLSACYGIWQTAVGLPPWDQGWVAQGGYAALSVNGVVRAFGSFSSSAEYAQYLGIGIAVIAARALTGRLRAIIALPLLGWALLLESARGEVVLVLVALLLMSAVRAFRAGGATVVTLFGLGVLTLLDYLFGKRLGDVAQSTPNPLLAHQLAGLANPLNPQTSTLLVHVQLVVGGFAQALHHPLGLGTAATTLAGRLAQAPTSAGTEVDVPNEFVSLGLAGGTLYLLIVVVTLILAVRLAARRRDMTSLAALGILTVSFGQWLDGSYYLLAPLVWLLIGWVNTRGDIDAAADDIAGGAAAAHRRAGEALAEMRATRR